MKDIPTDIKSQFGNVMPEQKIDGVMALDMSKFKGRSALDVMNAEDEENQKLKDLLPQGVDNMGPRMPT